MLAAAQVGMLRALIEAGIVPDLVIGTSAGALNAVAFASHPSLAGIARLAEVWISMRRRQVLPVSPRRLYLAATGAQDCLLDNRALRQLIRETLDTPRLEQTVVPAHVVVTELRSGRPIVVSDGDATDAVLASAAYPGVLPTVELNGRLVIDGGISAAIPILQAEALGAVQTYVLPSADPADTTAGSGPIPVAVWAVAQLLARAFMADIAKARSPVHVLPAPTSSKLNAFDFRDTPALIDQGYALASRWLELRAIGRSKGRLPTAS